jgi:hypothetical protein
MSPPHEGENKWENMDLDGLFEQTRMKCNNGPTGVWTQDPRGWYGPFIRGPRIISGPISTGRPQSPIQIMLYPAVIIKPDLGARWRMPNHDSPRRVRWRISSIGVQSLHCSSFFGDGPELKGVSSSHGALSVGTSVSRSTPSLGDLTVASASARERAGVIAPKIF